ncbi:thermonuclease family protein [Yersinia enterocolitica]
MGWKKKNIERIKLNCSAFSKVGFVALFIPLSFMCHADIDGRIVRILDGDTLEVLSDTGIRTRIRLEGIDAPEKAQPFGQRSRQALTKMTAGKVVHISGNKHDHYGRLLGTVWYESTDINAVQIKTGMAWAYRYNEKAVIPAYADLEVEARNSRAGLWVEPAQVEPWSWRNMQNNDN